MFTHVRNRRILLTLAAAGAALSLAVVTPAVATGGGTTHARTASATAAQGDPRDVTQRVANFYGAYIDSVWDLEDPTADANSEALRAFYLSSAAREEVAAYEAKEHADGILFAQNVPVKWTVSYTGSGAGHATSRVTLTWSDGACAEVTKIDVQSDLRTRKITELRQAG